METYENIVEVGVLAIQGAFVEHINALRRAAKELNIHLKAWEIRTSSDFTPQMVGLIIPGGESTSIGLFLGKNKMENSLREWTRDPRHVTWGTCAGMIMLSDEIENAKIDGQPLIGGLPVVVKRNYFGRQINSFESTLNVLDTRLTELGQGHLSSVFIRAPIIARVLHDDVNVLATITVSNDSSEGTITANSRDVGSFNVDTQSSDVIVAVSYKNLMASAFHPELTDDLRWHKYFLQMAVDRMN